jgi:hypothetical protein
MGFLTGYGSKCSIWQKNYSNPCRPLGKRFWTCGVPVTKHRQYTTLVIFFALLPLYEPELTDDGQKIR